MTIFTVQGSKIESCLLQVESLRERAPRLGGLQAGYFAHARCRIKAHLSRRPKESSPHTQQGLRPDQLLGREQLIIEVIERPCNKGTSILTSNSHQKMQSPHTCRQHVCHPSHFSLARSAIPQSASTFKLLSLS